MFKKISIILATIVSIIAIYQGIGAFCGTYAKAADLSELKVEVKTNALKQDTQYIQDRMWDMEDRYGFKKLNDKSPEIPKAIIHRYFEYKSQLDEKSDTLKMLMNKRINDIK